MNKFVIFLILATAIAVASATLAKARAESAFRDYRCTTSEKPLVLRARGSNQVVGVIFPGVLLFPPVRSDLHVTDQGDGELHKMYVRIPTNFHADSLKFPKDNARVEVGDVVNVSNLEQLTTEDWNEIVQFIQDRLTPSKHEKNGKEENLD
jgi:hypothetical protein